MATTAPAPYYDPYDFDIDADPYPVWKRLRDEAPLYFNEKYEFYAISRYDDVERALVEWQTYSSAKGSVLEIIKAGIEMPPGMFIFEDPPDHDLHRGIMSRVFTPRRMAAIEPQVRDYAARTLDPLVGAGGFDFIADLGAEIPMRTIGMLLGIPEEDQQAIRDHIDEGLRLEAGVMPEVDLIGRGPDRLGLRRLHRLARRASLRRPHDRAAHGGVHRRDRDGAHADPGRDPRLHRPALGGRQRDHHRASSAGPASSWPSTPSNAGTWCRTRRLIPAAIEECLRYEPPSPVQSRSVTTDVEHHGQTVPAGSVMVLLNASANRDERQFRRPGPLRHPPQGAAPPELRLRPALLPGRAPGAARGPRRARRGAQALPGVGRRHGQRGAGPDVDRARLGEAPGAHPVTPGPRAVPGARPWLRRS